MVLEIIFNFLKTYWVVITFFGGTILTGIRMYKNYVEATKCSLRNDILQIYDSCKDKKQITHYQLQAIKYSSELYFKMKGNSFVQDVIDRVKSFELVD